VAAGHETPRAPFENAQGLMRGGWKWYPAIMTNPGPNWPPIHQIPTPFSGSTGNGVNSRKDSCFKSRFLENTRFNQNKIGQFSGPAAAPEWGEVLLVDPCWDLPRKGPWRPFARVVPRNVLKTVIFTNKWVISVLLGTWGDNKKVTGIPAPRAGSRWLPEPACRVAG